MAAALDLGEIRKEGFVLKESAIIRQYRKRWLVLTRTHLYTFKKDRSYTDPTEVRVASAGSGGRAAAAHWRDWACVRPLAAQVVELKACGTVKSADDITNKPYSFTGKLRARGRGSAHRRPTCSRALARRVAAWPTSQSRCRTATSTSRAGTTRSATNGWPQSVRAHASCADGAHARTSVG